MNPPRLHSDRRSQKPHPSKSPPTGRTGTNLSIAISTELKILTGGWTPTLVKMSAVSIVGVPSSSGSCAAGQDQAPTVLRSAGLVDALSALGLEVHDEGDLPFQIWRPDRLNPRAQNLGEVTESIRELIERLIPPLACGDTLLVLGGNCTVALGVVAALCRGSEDLTGVLYVDRNYDINTPESTNDTDAPLAENTDGRNSGPTLDQVAVALRIAVQDARFRSLSIGELNPTRSAGDPDAIPRFTASVASVIGGMHR